MGKAVNSTDASKRHQFVGMAFVLLTKSAIMVFVKTLQITIKITGIKVGEGDRVGDTTDNIKNNNIATCTFLAERATNA